MKKIGIILNLSARRASQLDVNDIYKTINKTLPDATIYKVEGDIQDSVDLAIKDGCNVLCGGGGDGTISAVATTCAKKGIVLGILPLGTLNNFSKDVGISQSLTGACKIIKAGKTSKIDYATVNDQLFLNNSSVGAYAKFVRERERYQASHGKMWAYLIGLLSYIPKFKTLDLTLDYDGKKQIVQTPIVFVSNNNYSITQKPFMRRNTLSGGELSVHIVKRSHKHSVKNLFLLNKLKHNYTSFTTKHITIHADAQKATIAKDGEVIPAKLPLHYEMHNKALTIIVP
ncbi:MAG: hypothetical protein QG675_618 [Patescibacteria group bacterium]|jgi:diacylglycerol kinase family enzyme|nr:hypothetical protein [Patescibacteria group bacterium]